MASKLRLENDRAETPVEPAGTAMVVELLAVAAMPPQVCQPVMFTSAAVAVPTIARVAAATTGEMRAKSAFISMCSSEEV